MDNRNETPEAQWMPAEMLDGELTLSTSPSPATTPQAQAQAVFLPRQPQAPPHRRHSSQSLSLTQQRQQDALSPQSPAHAEKVEEFVLADANDNKNSADGVDSISNLSDEDDFDIASEGSWYNPAQRRAGRGTERRNTILNRNVELGVMPPRPRRTTRRHRHKGSDDSAEDSISNGSAESDTSSQGSSESGESMDEDAKSSTSEEEKRNKSSASSGSGQSGTALAATRSPLDQLFAVLERSTRQLWRRKLDFLLELVVPLIFIAVSIALWAIFGTEKKEEYFWSAYYGEMGSFVDDFYTSNFMCFTGPDTFTMPSMLRCTSLMSPICDGDSSKLPVPGLQLCRVSQTWEATLNSYLASLVGYISHIPRLDGLITMQWATLAGYSWIEQLITVTMSGLAANTRYSSILCSGNLYFVGPPTVTAGLIEYFRNVSTLFPYVSDGVVYSSVEEVRRYIWPSERLWGIIELKQFDKSGLDLVLHLNSSSLPSFGTTYDQGYPGGAQFDTAELYVTSGYLTLQQIVSEYYLNTVHDANMTMDHYIASVPTPPYTRIPLITSAKSVLPLIYALAFLYSVSQQVKRIVLEKELRIRESMLIMGLQQWTLYVSEFLLQLIIFVITCILCTIMLKLTYVTKSDPLVLFLVFFLFSLTTIPLSGIIAAFFSKARLASLVAPVVYFILVIPTFAMSNTSGAIVTGFSIFSPSGFAAAMNIFMLHESGSGMGGEQIRSKEDNPTLAVILGMLTADFVIYYLLMLYLDAVVPKEWGTPKHPLFFILDPIRWCRGAKHERLEGGPDGRAENGVFETTSYVDDVVSFDGLRKEYSRGGKRFTAVNNLYWGMRIGEISVLLGHNGAGKTTVLNMMTGMAEPDAGDCYIYGHSVRTEKSAVRQLLGFCPQHNILWSELTCRDHLEFYGKIKGLKGWELEDAVCRMLYETDMLDKIDRPAGSLSGGMKRKLSIAIAFVGGSRLVFLDEPTAGLDVAARRHVWELLKRMAQSRTLLLTTHYMDEADLLGSRIGIMSQGRLKCTGSSLFLKSRLGVGYNLDISVHANVEARAVDKMVLGYVSGATVLGRNGCELSYQLPTASATQFAALLNHIDSKDAAGIRGYALAATTLEEVFLKVSEEDLDCRRHKAGVAREQMRLIWHCERVRCVLWLQFTGVLSKRFWNALRDRRMQFFQILCPVVCVLIAMLLNLVNYDDQRSLTYTFDMFAREPTSELITTQCGAMLGATPSAPHVNIQNMTTYLPDYRHVGDYVLDTWFFHDAPRYGALICNNTFDKTAHGDSSKPSLYSMYNTSSHHQAPLNSALYYDLYAKQLGGPQMSMTYSATLFEKARAPTQFTTMFIGALIMVPFTFLPSVPVAWIVKERQCGSRHLQNLCGLNFFVYWVANFLFDMVAYFLTMLLCIVIFACFNRQEFVGNDRVGGTFVLFIVYGFTGTVFGYCLSFLFNEYSTAQTVTMITCFAVGFVLLMLVYVIEIDPGNSDIAAKMRWGCRVVPSYCIGEGIINLLQLGMRLQLGQATSVWDMDQLGWTLVYMAAEFPVFVLVALLADHPWFGRVLQHMTYRRERCLVAHVADDSDVEDERRAVAAAELKTPKAADDVVRVVNLQKKYADGHVAVKGITFSIFPGEIFGFLGTNGAGKTTTISMLCQQFLPSAGSAYICGHDIVSDSKAALQCVGYCPQFDATLDLLTVEEQLRLYAGIRGIVRTQWAALVDALCTLCELTMYRKTVTGELSGGNRRKLSVAMSLVGGPQVLFLDEPSAGMDPVARRGMWTAIQRAAKRCSVVLTTHHLEEVEALADTVAIMVDGSVQCFGDKVHLKNKFGSAFELSVLVSSAFFGARLERFVAANFPGAVCNESDGRRYVYQLRRDRPLGEIFQVLQANKGPLHITDYSVSQTSMEQIFLQVEKRAQARQLLESTLPSFKSGMF